MARGSVGELFLCELNAAFCGVFTRHHDERMFHGLDPCVAMEGLIGEKYQALTIAGLTYSPSTTKLARGRCYTMLSTLFKPGRTTYNTCVRGVWGEV